MKTFSGLVALTLAAATAAPAQTAADADFAARSTAPGVVRVIGFDAAADFNSGSGATNGAYGQNFGILPPSGTSDYTSAIRDTALKASGSGALRFTIPSNTSADTSGAYFVNFSSDLATRFGANSHFFIQWRQRFTSEFITRKYQGGGGFKQVIIGSGDHAGAIWSSCSSLELVQANYYQSGFPILYNSCSGSASHGAYDGFYEPYGAYDFKLQNARPSPFCLYSQKDTSYFPPQGNACGLLFSPKFSPFIL